MLLTKVSTYLALFSAGAVAFAPSLSTRETSSLHALNGQDLIDDGGRRAFLSSSVITALAGVGFAPEAHAFGKKGVDYKAVAGDISSIIKEDPNKGPTLVRLAWHSSGTYDKMSKDGGSGGGTIRFKEELAHGGNAGLGETAVPWMEDVKKKYGDSLSYADLYTLAGGKEECIFVSIIVTAPTFLNDFICCVFVYSCCHQRNGRTYRSMEVSVARCVGTLQDVKVLYKKVICIMF